ncbi:hypothetical protein [Nostoc sp. S13]|uniref:hypothetical protein n=1 Tax=Nostoc sp. S13 TaxID=3019266 RepID=UPI0026146B52|nr:hypothetical protein [Nostoc sp. S13]MDF5739076.1 hypothetical protein [Nostoc sp. S13]
MLRHGHLFKERSHRSSDRFFVISKIQAHCALVVALRYAPDDLEFAHARQHLEIAIALSGEYHKL